MRISIDQDSPDYHDHASFCRIYLAGAERNNVWLADEEARFALTIRLDEWGNPVKDRKTGEQVLDKFYGDVRVECGDHIREAMEHKPAEQGDALSLALYGMVSGTP